MIREKKTNGKQLIRQTSLTIHCVRKIFSLFFAILVTIVLMQILNPFTTNAYTNTVTATLSGTPNFDGLTSITVGDNGVKDPPLVEFKAGKQGWRTDRATATWYINCNVDDSFINGGTNTVGVTVEYFDEGSGIFCLQYDSSSGSAFKETEVVRLTNTNLWKKYTFELTDAKFANGTNGADFRIAIISSTEWSSSDVCIQNISVAKLQQASDVTTNTTSGKVDKGTAVTLSSTTSNSAIYYTTDGSDPKASTSKQKYNKPIIINSCTTIKAFAVSDTTAKSNISTFSYFSTYVNTIFTNIAQFNGITAYPADDPSKLQITTKGGKQCWKINISNNMKYIYCDIDNNYIFGGTNKVGITVEYFDEGNGQFFYVL